MAKKQKNKQAEKQRSPLSPSPFMEKRSIGIARRHWLSVGWAYIIKRESPRPGADPVRDGRVQGPVRNLSNKHVRCCAVAVAAYRTPPSPQLRPPHRYVVSGVGVSVCFKRLKNCSLSYSASENSFPWVLSLSFWEARYSSDAASEDAAFFRLQMTLAP